DSGTTPFVFAISLTNPSTFPISVQVDVADGTAVTDDHDYLPVPRLVLTFNPGDPLIQTVTIGVVGDIKTETVETFVVNLSHATGVNVSIAKPVGLGTILNDDPDSDGEGISDKIENLGPNAGDANTDGIPDRFQANVAALPDG